MSVGRRQKLLFQAFQDEITGLRVLRLTPPEVPCHRNYFYQKCFTADGAKLVYGSRFGASWDLCLLDLAAGESLQLTEGDGCNTFGCFLSPDDRFLFYVRDRKHVRRIDLANLSEDTLFTVPAGWQGVGTWVPNSACTRLAGMLIRSEDLAGGQGWEKFRAQFDMNPLCRLVSIDLRSGEFSTVFEQRKWMGHPMYRPFDDQTMAFCHEGPHDLVDARMWLINQDGSGLRRVKEHAPGECCMHEFWVPDGSRMIYVSYREGEQQRWICAADPLTLENERIMPMPPCSHLMSNHDGSLLVGDGAGQLNDVSDAAAHAFEPDPHLYLFDLARRSVQPIVAHKSSWRERYGRSQMTHPHPSFTPDERCVLYTSDFEGEPALYLADLPL